MLTCIGVQTSNVHQCESPRETPTLPEIPRTGAHLPTTHRLQIHAILSDGVLPKLEGVYYSIGSSCWPLVSSEAAGRQPYHSFNGVFSKSGRCVLVTRSILSTSLQINSRRLFSSMGSNLLPFLNLFPARFDKGCRN
jgi:hypothetical protein